MSGSLGPFRAQDLHFLCKNTVGTPQIISRMRDPEMGNLQCTDHDDIMSKSTSYNQNLALYTVILQKGLSYAQLALVLKETGNDHIVKYLEQQTGGHEFQKSSVAGSAVTSPTSSIHNNYNIHDNGKVINGFNFQTFSGTLIAAPPGHSNGSK